MIQGLPLCRNARVTFLVGMNAKGPMATDVLLVDHVVAKESADSVLT